MIKFIFKMGDFEVYISKKSEAFKLIYGRSTSGKISIDDIFQLDVSSADELLLKALEVSNPNKTLIVIYDNVISLLEPTQILDALEYFTSNVDYDIFYLTRYGDLCEPHTDFKKYKSIDFMKVLSPHGIESLMISPSGKTKINGKLNSIHGRGADFILNSMSGIMNNYSAYPTIFNIDLTKRINNNDLAKATVCKEAFYIAKPPKLSTRNTSATNLFWFILVILFIFFLASLAMSFSDKDKTLYANIDTGTAGIGPNDGTGDLKTYRIP